ncbi:hypothetical protein D3C86_2018700 [compost metagenome]
MDKTHRLTYAFTHKASTNKVLVLINNITVECKQRIWFQKILLRSIQKEDIILLLNVIPKSLLLNHLPLNIKSHFVWHF